MTNILRINYKIVDPFFYLLYNIENGKRDEL